MEKVSENTVDRVREEKKWRGAVCISSGKRKWRGAVEVLN